MHTTHEQEASAQEIVHRLSCGLWNTGYRSYARAVRVRGGTPRPRAEMAAKHNGLALAVMALRIMDAQKRDGLFAGHGKAGRA